MRTRLLTFAGLTLLAATSAVRANILTNGSLELRAGLAPVTPDNLFYASGNYYSHALPGWGITGASTGGSIDLIPTSYFTPSDGNYCIDLIGTPNKVGGGNGIGGIQQTAITSVGRKYTLAFDFSVNPEDLTSEGGSVKSMIAEAIASNGTTVLASEVFTLPTGTRTKSDLQWVSESLDFTATSPNTTIRLRALTPSGLPGTAAYYCGPLVDNVILLAAGGPGDNPGGGEPPVPEPASLAMLGLGLPLLLRRRGHA